MKILFTNIDGVSGKLSVMVQHGKESVVFDIYSLIKRVNKNILRNEIQFDMLVAYLEYIGKTDMVFKIYKKLDNDIVNIVFHGDDVIKKEMWKLLNLIDIKKIADWLESGKYPFIVPSRFKEVFDQQQEIDGRLTRVQTYTRREYLELVAVVLGSKILIGPLGEYSNISGESLPQTSREYILVSSLANNPNDTIFASPTVDKIKTMMSMQIENDSVIDRLIPRIVVPREDVPNYLFYTTFVRNYCISMPELDTHGTNIVTMSYNKATSLLNGGSSADKRFTFKAASATDEDSESSMEIYRKTTDVSLGDLEELEFFAKMIVTNMTAVGLDANKHYDACVNVIEHLRKMYGNHIIPDSTLVMTANIMHAAIDSRAILGYISLDGLIHLIAVTFIYLWENDHRDLARLLLVINLDSDELLTSSSVTENADKEALLRLTQKYDMPRTTIKKRGSKESKIFHINLHLVEIVKLFTHTTSRYVCPDQYLEGLPRNVELPSDLKNRLIKLYEGGTNV